MTKVHCTYLLLWLFLGVVASQVPTPFMFNPFVSIEGSDGIVFWAFLEDGPLTYVKTHLPKLYSLGRLSSDSYYVVNSEAPKN